MLTSIDVNLKEHVEVMAQNAGETLDTLIAAQLSANNTAQYAGGQVALSSITSANTMTGQEVRRAVRTLKLNKARLFEDGLFKAIIPVHSVYDLRSNTEWLDAFRYADPLNIQDGEVGMLHGVRFYETNNEISQSSTVTVYATFFYGQNAFGILNLEGQPGKRIYVKMPSDSSTDNPVDTFATVGWKAFFTCVVLNTTWVVACWAAAGA